MKPTDPTARDAIFKVLDESGEMSLGTCRPDGFPQVTTVNFVHGEWMIYCAFGLDSQKAHNIRLNPKVSGTINRPNRDWHELQGLSFGGSARILTVEAEMRVASERLLRRFPHLRQFIRGTEAVPWAGMLFIEIAPKVISILDYRKRFGHTELVEVG
ncbi:MAG: pyridoxamine 5'-phosphate oxidase family protein [Pseudomonadota bacterium]|nr:pyridoxamine 5'-phosphate oxidase family protein [Pseudomonadota bacterium]